MLNPTSTRPTFFLIGLILLILLTSAIIPQQGFAEEQIIDWKNALGDKYVIIEKLGLDRIYYTPYFYIILFLFSVNLTAVNIKRFKLAYKVERTLIKAKYLGSIIFHFSLLLIIAGIILNYLYKFNGIYALTEGQKVSDTE
ncbi:MAG: cytochrome c biogenesis protein ResB, partial [Candidatus Zixiibacteriota bacterium]